jgi:hypothetical protein
MEVLLVPSCPLRREFFDLLKKEKRCCFFETNFPDSIDVIPELKKIF